MSKIKVRNFGPIKEGYQENDGWIDIKKVTLFIGNQGSGKSTLAKLISCFTWIEKVLVRGDYEKKIFEDKGYFREKILAYHRIENYFHHYHNLFDETCIEYLGDAYEIKYLSGRLSINERNSNKYHLPQLMYVPAERNFIANVKTPKALKLTSDSLIEFVTEFDNAKNKIDDSIKLPLNNTFIEYDSNKDIVNIRGHNYTLKLAEASSGFQSLVPLYLVSLFLSNTVKNQLENDETSSEERERFRKGVSTIWADDSLTDAQRRVALSVLSSKFNKTAFINIVEEPEQNLFPTSQWKMLESLLEFNNSSKGNKLIMTTHSPYLVNFLSIAIQAEFLKEKVKTKELTDKLEEIINLEAVINSSEVVIYELLDNGLIKKLPNFEGIPSDDNFLNKFLKEGNLKFDNLLAIEESL